MSGQQAGPVTGWAPRSGQEAPAGPTAAQGTGAVTWVSAEVWVTGWTLCAASFLDARDPILGENCFPGSGLFPQALPSRAPQVAPWNLMLLEGFLPARFLERCTRRREQLKWSEDVWAPRRAAARVDARKSAGRRPLRAF